MRYKDEDILQDINYRKSRNLLLLEYYKHFNEVKERKSQDEYYQSYYKTEYIRATPKGDTKVEQVSGRTITKVRDCSTYIELITDEDFNHKKVIRSNRCFNKHCSHCIKIRSTKNALSLNTLYSYLKDVNNYEYIFLTLTSPNVVDEELEQEILDYSYSFGKLMKRKAVKKIVKGYICKLEITRNEKREDCWHVHYHVLIAVPKSYFTSRDYIKRSEWLELWRESKKDNTITQVDVRKVKNKSDGISSEILELSKYMSKDDNGGYMADVDTFKVFYNATSGKRFLKYGGAFKKALTLYKNGELEKYKPIDNTEYIYLIRYLYLMKNKEYKRDTVRELTPQELLEIINNERKNLHLEFDAEQ